MSVHQHRCPHCRMAFKCVVRHRAAYFALEGAIVQALCPNRHWHTKVRAT